MAKKKDEKPTQGQQVHFVEMNGFHSLATVTRVLSDGTLHLFVMRADDVIDNRSVRGVSYDEGINPGTWHWIESE